MTTEEKAKAYDEVLEKFRPIYELAKQQGRNIDNNRFHRYIDIEMLIKDLMGCISAHEERTERVL